MKLSFNPLLIGSSEFLGKRQNSSRMSRFNPLLIGSSEFFWHKR